MDKQHILNEIKRTAEENGGRPLGRKRFQTETGIAYSDWYGKHWARWSDAVAEAGYEPNALNPAYEDSFLLDKLASLIEELGRFPVSGELRLKAKEDPSFPSHNTFRRFGRKAQMANRLMQYCREAGGFEDVVAICEPIASKSNAEPEHLPEPSEAFGHVYLIKSGRYYKIGRSNAPGRREYELAIQLPEKVRTVHTIKTDDPAGIEDYWHRRFDDKRKRGEWFELSKSDVTAFKRRRFM